MSKFILLILFLFDVYYCTKKEEPETFLINPNSLSEKEITIKSGKEFVIKLACFSSSYVLLNKKDNNDVIVFQKTGSIDEHYDGENIGGRRGYLLYYFKTNSITNEPRVLKFTDTYSYLRQSNPIPKLIVKVNIVE